MKHYFANDQDCKIVKKWKNFRGLIHWKVPPMLVITTIQAY